MSQRTSGRIHSQGTGECAPVEGASQGRRSTGGGICQVDAVLTTHSPLKDRPNGPAEWLLVSLGEYASLSAGEGRGYLCCHKHRPPGSEPRPSPEAFRVGGSVRLGVGMMAKRGRPRVDAPERFWAKVNKSGGGCWEWTGPKARGGYGAFWTGTKQVGAHCYAYELLIGPIPEGCEIDHLCRNHGCVNAAHMEAVTHQENTLRGNTQAARHAAKTHCPQGHAYDLINTYRRPDGCRQCRTCRREADNRRHGR